jgi:hypothetical protein
MNMALMSIGAFVIMHWLASFWCKISRKRTGEAGNAKFSISISRAEALLRPGANKKSLQLKRVEGFISFV